MRTRSSFWVAAALALLGSGLDSPAASAWDAGRGRYSPSYYGPPVLSASPPAVVYPGPPVYYYSYVDKVEGGYGGRPAYGSAYGSGYYTAGINVLRGPRWDYSASYYTSPGVRAARQARRGGLRRYCPPHRAFIRGPIVRTSQPW